LEFRKDGASFLIVAPDRNEKTKGGEKERKRKKDEKKRSSRGKAPLRMTE